MMIFNLMTCTEVGLPTVEWEQYCDDSQLTTGDIEIISVKGLESLKIITRRRAKGQQNQRKVIEVIQRVQGLNINIFLKHVDTNIEHSIELDSGVIETGDEDLNQNIMNLKNQISQLFPSATILNLEFTSSENIRIQGVY